MVQEQVKGRLDLTGVPDSTVVIVAPPPSPQTRSLMENLTVPTQRFGSVVTEMTPTVQGRYSGFVGCDGERAKVLLLTEHTGPLPDRDAMIIIDDESVVDPSDIVGSVGTLVQRVFKLREIQQHPNGMLRVAV